MSCNLEHALHNKLNCTDKEKRSLAEQFDDKYAESVEAFKHFIAGSVISVSGSYTDSWDFIRIGKNSLQRHTNLGLSWEKEQD